MDKKRELDEKLTKISYKLGALFMKELLNKQYKLNYYQRIRAQGQAFNKWKAQFRESVTNEQKAKRMSSNSKSTVSGHPKRNLKIKGKRHVSSNNNKSGIGGKTNNLTSGNKGTKANQAQLYINKHKVRVSLIHQYTLNFRYFTRHIKDQFGCEICISTQFVAILKRFAKSNYLGN